MNQPITSLQEIYTIFAQAVAGMPPIYPVGGGEEMRCKRLNTFAVMKSIKEFDADNGGKSSRYATAPYYFNRRWSGSGTIFPEAALDYPVCAVAEESFTLNVNSHDKQVLNLIIADLAPRKDVIASSADGGSICNNRTEEDVAEGCRMLMKTFFSIISKYAWTEVDFAVGPTLTDWYNVDWLKSEKDAGRVVSYYAMDELTLYIQTKEITGDIFHMVESGNLVVAVARFTVETDACLKMEEIPVYPPGFAPGVTIQPNTIFINDELNAE